MSDSNEKARRAERAAGSGNTVCCGGEQCPGSLTPAKNQVFPLHERRRPHSPRGEIRRAPVRIVAIDGRYPHHSTYSFNLDDRELEQLVRLARWLEARR
jgi:hypothetical protein